jgi:hypothetical protein
VNTGRQRLQFGADGGEVWSLAFSSDGKFLTTAQTDFRLWEVATGKELCNFQKTLDHGTPVAFAPDGRSIVIRATGENTLCFWDPLTGMVTRPLERGIDRICSLAFSPNGKLLATGHEDGSILLWDVARLILPRPRRSLQLSPRELDTCWADLAGADPRKAWQALGSLAAAPEQAVPFLQARLRPAPSVESSRLVRLVADLDHDRFEVRRQATAELEQLGELAEPILRQTLTARPSLEVRHRVEQLLNRLEEKEWVPPAEELRGLRALVVLERINTLRTQHILAALAAGAPGSRLTREAGAALQRATRLPSTP